MFKRRDLNTTAGVQRNCAPAFFTTKIQYHGKENE
jgi:hypothetical protein